MATSNISVERKKVADQFNPLFESVLKQCECLRKANVYTYLKAQKFAKATGGQFVDFQEIPIAEKHEHFAVLKCNEYTLTAPHFGEQKVQKMWFIRYDKTAITEENVVRSIIASYYDAEELYVNIAKLEVTGRKSDSKYAYFELAIRTLPEAH